MKVRCVHFAVLLQVSTCAWSQTIYEGYSTYYSTQRNAIFGRRISSPLEEGKQGEIFWKGRRPLLSTAMAFPGELTRNDSLGDHAVSYEDGPLACIEGTSSSASGTAVRHQSVYLIDMRDAKRTRLYKLPSLFASCRGVRVDDRGRVMFDAVDYVYDDGGDNPTGVMFREHVISDKRFFLTGRTVTARFVESENVWRFVLDGED